MIRQECSHADLQDLVSRLRFKIGNLLPIVIRIDPRIKMRGHNGDVPTHDVTFVDVQTTTILEQMYKETYKQKEGHTSYPTLSAHVTVDNSERKAIIDEILGKSNGLFVVNTVYLKQLGFKDTLFSTRAL